MIIRFIYSRYHIITDVCTRALVLTKPSSDDNSGFKHGFGAEASLSLAQSTPAVSHDTTKLCQIYIYIVYTHTDTCTNIYIYIYIYSPVYFLKCHNGAGKYYHSDNFDELF